MTVIDLLKKYSELSKLEFEKYNDDGWAEKLSRKFSFIMMVIFTMCLAIFQLVGRPITCWFDLNSLAKNNLFTF
jgi:hypothetical protein